MSPDGAEWLRYAEDDLAGAYRLLTDVHLPARLACFHAQQAAEKALKAALATAGTRIPRTHDLVALLMLSPVDVRTELAVVDLTMLDPWAVDARYPGDIPDATADEASAVIEIAAAVVRIVNQQLSED